jgi:glutathione synthase/RimK-type ligase-like ATP-grasp enzyme
MSLVPGGTMAMRVLPEKYAGDAAFEAACALHDVFRNREAERAYLEILARDPTHFGALTNLGTLLHVAGNRTVARALYTKAAAEHPNEPIAFVNLGNALVEDRDVDAAIATYQHALTVAPGFPNAYFALSLLYRALGRDDDALRARQLAFAKPIVSVRPALGTDDPIDLLLLISANGGNVVTAPLLDRSIVRTYQIVVEGYREEMELPAHHAIFNAVGDADRATDALDLADAIVRRSAAPAINAPARIVDTGRAAVTRRLAAIPNVVTPRTQRFARAALDAAALAAAGFTYPVLLRSPGYHTGEHFTSVASADELADARDALPGDELLAIAYLDGRGDDGNYRKYRVLFIDGRLYALHLAIARDWKVHYFSSDMNDRPDHRAEEAAFLADMHGVLGPRAVAALERIRDTLALDYGGVDFGLDRAGNVLVYEANATMVVLPPPPDERFAYRIPVVARALDAAHDLIRSRATRGGFRGTPVRS